MLSKWEKLWTRLATKRVVLSSSERTMAPSLLLLSNSYNPGNPVTAMILLYSMQSFYSRMKRMNEILGTCKLMLIDDLGANIFTAKLDHYWLGGPRDRRPNPRH